MPEQDHYIKAPLMSALADYADRQDTSLHVPGHKNGRVLSKLPEAAKYFRDIAQIDGTEITGLDDLHHPEGAIAEAQEQAAQFFGAEASFFLVGGSTAGNLGLILTVCTEPRDILLVQRNVHKSVIHGLMLAGANAVFLTPQADPASGLMTIPSAETVREALRRYPGAKGLLVTHPNYYGMGSPLAPLAELCHSSGIPLLVDEAHGAHFGLHPELPQSALGAGADGVVQSTHKMLSALTMGAMLHVQGSLIDRTLLRQRLAMVQSSSPSYPIMASLDLTRCLLEEGGTEMFSDGLQAADILRQGIKRMERFGVVEPLANREERGTASDCSEAYMIQDPFKIVIYDKSKKLSGYKLQVQLEEYGCVPEMSDPHYVVLALSLGTTKQDADRVLTVLAALDKEHESTCTSHELSDNFREEEDQLSYTIPEDLKNKSEKSENPDVSERRCDKGEQEQQVSQKLSTWNILGTEGISDEVIFRMTPINIEDTEAVEVEQTEGRIAAEMVIPYPPGIPVLYPGERITSQMEQYLRVLHGSGAKCQGTDDPTMRTIRVYKLQQKVGS